MGVTKEDVEFSYGKTIERAKMVPRTIYLDGVVRGPVVDNERRTYSFDHHGDCVRLATLATCQQVRTAIELGLDPAGYQVVLNELDADGSFALWLLRHPQRAEEPRVIELIDCVGFIDAHGPVREVPDVMRALDHEAGEKQTAEMLWEDQRLIEEWYRDGDEALPKVESTPQIEAYGLTRDGTVEAIDGITGFSDLYEQGYVAGLLCPDSQEETTGYVVAKRSDFVDYDIAGFLDRMNALESGWGGGSTVGGAPRRSDGRRSDLPLETVLEVFREGIGTQCTP